MQLFQTQNLALANTLITCGVPPYEEDGKRIFVMNTYTPEIIRQHARYRGWTYERAVENAVENGIPGNVTYCFKDTPELQEICKAFDSQKELIKEQAENAPQKPLESAGELDLDLDAAGRFAAQWANNRGHLLHLWRKAVPMLAYPGPTQTKKEGEKTVSVGSMKLVSLNASKGTKHRLHL